MIELTPTIMSYSSEDFSDLITRYNIFTSIDIDIVRSPFEGKETLQIDEILNLAHNLSGKTISFHIMSVNPIVEIEKLIASEVQINNKLRAYVHQESEIDWLIDRKDEFPFEIDLCISIDTEFKDLEYYKKFTEIQLMSHSVGVSNTGFDSRVEGRVEYLRKIGYNGRVSLDGGVSLESAIRIKNLDIQKVTANTYFKGNEDVQVLYKQLFEALNTLNNIS
jgi:pentose-5-phosphate-3-epimerase